MPQKYGCASCNYQFTPKKDKTPLLCPFCGKTGTVEKIKLMQEFIDEAIAVEKNRASFRA